LGGRTERRRSPGSICAREKACTMEKMYTNRRRGTADRAGGIKINAQAESKMSRFRDGKSEGGLRGRERETNRARKPTKRFAFQEKKRGITP